MRRLHRRHHAAIAAAALLLALGVAGCSPDKILEVQDPDVLTPAALGSADALPALVNGARGDFARGYQGDGNGNESSGQIGYGGLLADEWVSSGTFPTRHEIDQRNIQRDNGSSSTMFSRLSVARGAAELAARRYAALAPDDAGHALALNLDGFATILFGEDYCSGVPISNVEDDGSLTFGTPLTTEQMFQRAVAKFDTALTVSAATEDDQNMAKVGRGRALLDLGQFAEAAAAVAGVPDDFVFLIESSSNTNREVNGIFQFNFLSKRLSVADKEGTNGLDYVSSHDPRVQVRFDSTKGKPTLGQDLVTPLIEQLKYPNRDADVPLATGIEARLIEAEAALQNGGDVATMVAKLNAARAATMASLGEDPATLPDLTLADVPADLAGRVNLLFRERAFDLWLTAHRLGDLRRLIRQYGRGAETVFPTGHWFKGGTYGTFVSMPVPQAEDSNPNFSPDACDPTKP
jgi:hypothetical protein